MRDAIVFIVTYEGCDYEKELRFPTYSAALEMIEEMEGQYPNRKWYIVEKEVS
jgi:hypothetical protein